MKTENSMVIPLTKGLVAIVDPSDFEYLNQWKWQAIQYSRTSYAGRSVRTAEGRKIVRMHRQLCPEATRVDHRDGNGLNNQRHNLRPCTATENNRNARRRLDNTTGYKGVGAIKGSPEKVRSRIRHEGKMLSLGVYANKELAALVYNWAAIMIYGDFAQLNVIPGYEAL